MPRRPLPLLLAVAATAVATVALQPVATSATPADDRLPAAEARQLAAGLQVAPKADLAAVASGAARPAGPNPYLALVPDPAAVDYAGWKAFVDAQGEARAAQRSAQPSDAPQVHDELEPGTYGGNDTLATAEVIGGFGTRGRQDPYARILGDLTNEVVSAPVVPSNAEDDGSIPLARDVGVEDVRPGATVSGVRGDGPHGSAGTGSGDFDFYALDLTAGRLLTATVSTPTGTLDPVAVLYDGTGEILALNDDADGTTTDSALGFQVPATGTYFLMVSGYSEDASLPDDPFDAASGSEAGSEGPYDLVITSGAADRDVFAVDVRPGDVLAASVTGGAARLEVFDPAGVERQGSQQDVSGVYPAASPLPGGGNAVVSHVVFAAGRHSLAVSHGAGAYDVVFEAHRAGVQDERRGVQTLFVDFDGARVDTSIFGGSGVRELSPLRSFLGRWDLGADDEDALIDAIMATVVENVAADLEASGLNRQFDVRILNSRDHRDPARQENASRLVVGGTVAESGLFPTIGIAQSVDPGNFGHDETALVLLDILSAPAGQRGDPSLNTYLTAATEERIGFVGRAVGNLASHEAGHLLGSWHTDPFDEVADLMDQGGNFPLQYGVGDDGVGGTADDPDVDFGADVYVPIEEFTGLQSTLASTVFGLTRD